MIAPRFFHLHGASLPEGALGHSTRLLEKTSLPDGALVHSTGLRKLAEAERAAWPLPIADPHGEAAPEESSSA